MASARVALLVPLLTAAAPAAHGPFCDHAYADDLSALAPRARELEEKSQTYTFCVRSSAVYECPSYGPDGNLRGTRREVTAHGTGFGLRRDGGDTLVVTNEHVAEWPAVTGADHDVQDVPPGCKRVSDSLKIVDAEEDVYDRDDVPLARVVVDPQTDVAVLRAHAALPVIPWKIGRSAALRERDVVNVRGFPLGVLRANNVGKVISAYSHDDEGEWDHDDFVTDALLSSGGSGSPVLAISCRTGEFELVGVYHAGYARAAALNVVVGIDQVRDMLRTLKRTPRPPSAPDLDPAARVAVLAGAGEPLFFPFGPLTARVHTREDAALVYEVFGRDFPVHDSPLLVIEDRPADGAFGEPGDVFGGSARGLKRHAWSSLSPEDRNQLTRVIDALRRTSVAAVAMHTAELDPASTRERFRRMQKAEKELRRLAGQGATEAQAALELAVELAPARGEDALRPAVVRGVRW